MARISIDLTLAFATPPSVGAAGAVHAFADKVITRNAIGEFIIPASQVKGKLRHACEQILRSQNVPICHPPRPDRMCPTIDADDLGRPLPLSQGGVRCIMCHIFGSPAYPSRLRFLDLVVDQSQLPTETFRQMVSLNRVRRTAQEHRLFLIETAPHFDGLSFTKTDAITGYVTDRRHLHLLLVGLKALFSWGGAASRGMGWGSAEFAARLDGELVVINKQEVAQLWRS